MSLTLPKPSPATVAALTEPWWQSRTLRSMLISALTGFPVLLQQIHAIPGLVLPTWLNHLLAFVAVVAMWIAPMYARAGGVAAAGRVAEIAVPVPDLKV